jgi:ribonuclease-3
VLSPSEARTGGREKDTILADACEALIAALYLDGGLKAAKAFIETYWADEFAASGDAPRDPKTTLQEWAAQRKRPNPRYDVIERSGPDHAPRFVVEASVEGLDAKRGEGGSKRDAEREAARALLKAVGVRV